MVSGRLYVERQYNDARDYSAEAAFAIRENIDAVVVRHLSAVQALAGSLAAVHAGSGPLLNHWLAGVALVYPDFQDLMVADRAGNVLGAGARRVSLQAALSGRLRDRDFFRRTVCGGEVGGFRRDVGPRPWRTGDLSQRSHALTPTARWTWWSPARSRSPRFSSRTGRSA